MASTGFTLVTVGTNHDDGTGDAWTNPERITADDDSAALNSLAVGAPDSQLLYGDTLGFSVPSGATIDGIEARIDASVLTGVCDDRTARLFDTAGSPKGDDKADATDWASTPTLRTYGGTTDLWGASWSDTDVNDADFGFGIAAKFVSGAFASANVDFMQLNVHFTDAAGLAGHGLLLSRARNQLVMVH